MDNELVTLSGESIQRRLREQGFKHWWVAETMGVDWSTLRRWMSGKISRGRRERVSRLAGVLQTSVEELVERRATTSFV